MELKRLKGGFTGLVEFSLSNAEQGSRQFTVSLTKITRFVPPTLEKNTLDAAQFIGFRQPGVLSRTRLNSLFGPELVQRSNVSVDAVLDWDTQFLTEPPPAAGPIDEPNGAFDGANGLYFWELFFHLPHLVATRLRAEDRYLEAQNWLHYVFDPQAVETSVEPKKPRFWRCRPLYSEGESGTKHRCPPILMRSPMPRHSTIRFCCSPST